MAQVQVPYVSWKNAKLIVPSENKMPTNSQLDAVLPEPLQDWEVYSIWFDRRVSDLQCEFVLANELVIIIDAFDLRSRCIAIWAVFNASQSKKLDFPRAVMACHDLIIRLDALYQASLAIGQALGIPPQLLKVI